LSNEKGEESNEEGRPLRSEEGRWMMEDRFARKREDGRKDYNQD
jgi:hypothetical protein